ncbi:MAG TPA: thiolase family protein [Bacillota bacterium]|jgi:acetyl-CoA C-acetyltransferase|nr:thiolase family protein [Bacillota bacterium]HOB87047.1 thiolase family protein [Bacillota bacterium]HOP68921.1 thiolase family protein [Bacillota bacterium]HPT33428.1 thiolase family protein [Bacillota bacterium]HPZ65509.1 thiolase family protein [Bacillota bacterium]
MAKRVGIVGAAVTPFKAKWYEKTYYELAQMATAEALADAGLQPQDIDGVFYGIYNDIFQRTCIPEHPLQGIIGLQNKFGMRISNGGATGAYTLSAAHAYVAAGRFKAVLVLGVEKATDCFDFQSMSATPEVIKTIGWSGDSFYEQKLGWTAADSYAEVVLAYKDEFPGDLKPEVTAKISSLLSEQARSNSFAQRQFDQVTPEEVLNSRIVVEPFKELEICVYSEGAAALVVAEEETAKAISRNTGQPVVWITGVGESNEHSFAGRNHKIMYRIVSDHIAAKLAYQMAGIKDPLKAVDVVEAHDAFVHQLEITMAEMGFVPLGQADRLIEDGLILPGGPLLLNPCGGLIYSGHAVGASNIMSAWSARNELIRRRLKTALVHGTGSTIAQYGVVIILEHD